MPRQLREYSCSEVLDHINSDHRLLLRRNVEIIRVVLRHTLDAAQARTTPSLLLFALDKKRAGISATI